MASRVGFAHLEKSLVGDLDKLGWQAETYCDTNTLYILLTFATDPGQQAVLNFAKGWFWKKGIGTGTIVIWGQLVGAVLPRWSLTLHLLPARSVTSTPIPTLKPANFNRTLSWIVMGTVGLALAMLVVFGIDVTFRRQKAATLIELGNQRLQYNDFPGAIQAYEQSFTSRPLNRALILQYGHTQLRQGNYKEAVQAYGLVVEINPQDVRSLHQILEELITFGGIEPAGLFLKTLQETAPQTADTYYYQCQLDSAQDVGTPDSCTQAVSLYEQQLTVNSQNVSAMTKKGMALLELDNTEDALSVCAQATQIDPKYIYAHYCKVLALLELERYEEAVSAIEPALATDPRDFECWTVQGIAQIGTKSFPDALASFDQAVKLAPGYPPAKQLQSETEQFVELTRRQTLLR